MGERGEYIYLREMGEYFYLDEMGGGGGIFTLVRLGKIFSW